MMTSLGSDMERLRPTADGIREWRHRPPTVSVEYATRGPAGHRSNEARVQPDPLRQRARQMKAGRHPGHERPVTGLAVDQEIETDREEIGHIGERSDLRVVQRHRYPALHD